MAEDDRVDPTEVARVQGEIVGWIYEQEIERLEAEIERLRRCLAVAAPPEGGPVVVIPVSTLETLTNSLETAEQDAVRAVIRYVHTLNDLYHWNEWLCERLEDRFLS